MGAISLIKTAAESVGITAVVSDSETNLKTQLNRLKDDADDPQALIGWDLVTTTEFDLNGFLTTPKTPVVMLLMSKADSREKDDREAKSEEMVALFFKFLEELRGNLVSVNRTEEPTQIITGIEATNMPKYGMSQHAGCVGKFTMISDYLIDC